MDRLCEVCGNPATETHHLIFGTSRRRRCDDDGITMELCFRCHKELHYGTVSQKLSKMLGQMRWEQDALDDGADKYDVRNEFRERYGKSWL